MTKRTIESAYWIGDVVYLRVADEPLRGMITQVMFAGDNSQASYNVYWGDKSSTWNFGMELTTEYIPEYARTDNETDDKKAK